MLPCAIRVVDTEIGSCLPSYPVSKDTVNPDLTRMRFSIMLADMAVVGVLGRQTLCAAPFSPHIQPPSEAEQCHEDRARLRRLVEVRSNDDRGRAQGGNPVKDTSGQLAILQARLAVSRVAP